jgi:hypothetical protein
MINLTFTVDNIHTVLAVGYNYIEVRRGLDPNDFATFSGLDGTQLTPYPIQLVDGTTIYRAADTTGLTTDWYISRYTDDYTTESGIQSGWSDPVLGEPGDIYYDPLYPPEISYGTADQLVINRIRRLIGDPIGLRREYGDEAESSIHFDNKTDELDEKGWPADVHMGGVAMNDSLDPTINGYRYLKFDQDISITTWSGCIAYGVDIWYYTFRWSDREIMDAYDTCPPPVRLTTITATPEAYMLQTAIELLYSEVWEASSEDGAVITDEGTKYDPSPGLDTRKALLDNLQKKLDKLTESLILTGITGVLID